MELNEIIFLCSLLLISYVYIAFPITLLVLSNFFKNNLFDSNQFIISEYSSISIIIAAYNEEAFISSRLANILSLKYPHQMLDVIVASDGSQDKTVNIARKHNDVKVLDFPTNRGRAAVHNDAAKHAKGDILIFSDAETEFHHDFLIEIARMFDDPEYGAGAGEYVFKSKSGAGESEGFYWKLEKKLRYYEHILGVLPFASGGCFAIRRELFEEIPLHSDIDNVLPLRVISKGKKIFYCKSAVAYDTTIETPEQHYRKRYRTALRSMGDIIAEFHSLVRAEKFKELFVLFSHRLLRWWVSFAFPVVFLSNIALLHDGLFYEVFLLIQIIFYTFSILGYFNTVPVPWSILRRLSDICYSFSVANLSFARATIDYMKGKKIASYKTK